MVISVCFVLYYFFFSSIRRQTLCALVTGVQTCALPICDYRVVCPDVVGRGKSDWLINAAGYVVPQYVADILTLIARLNPARLDWVGTSMGGLIDRKSVG